MKVKVSIELYPDKIKALNDAVEPSLQQAAFAVKTDVVSSQVVPKDTGELERSGFVRKKSRSKYQIVFDTPYARKLYWHPEYNFRTDKNPNAQGLWLQEYQDGFKKNLFSKTFKKFYKENTKGLVT